MALFVIDTNVLYSAVRSRQGASFQLLSLVGTGAFDIAISVPLVLEYEDVLLRQLATTKLRKADVSDIVDYMCSVATHQRIFFLWRPLLRDPKDDHIAEVAVAAGCDAIVTFNKRDFDVMDQFGIRVISPVELLWEIGEV